MNHEATPTDEKSDPVMTATEVKERLEALNAAIREKESIIDKWREEIAEALADRIIESVGDDLSTDLLEQLIAIRDGDEPSARYAVVSPPTIGATEDES